MEENRIKIKVTGDAVTALANRGRRSGNPWLVVGGLLMVPIIASGIFLAWPRTYNSPSSVILQSAKPQATGQGLQRTTSLVFSKETLQRALKMLSVDIDVPLEIAGRDLQLEGITKNQSFGIDLRNQPASEILLAVLLRANPDQTASGPEDVKQKLVYIIRQSEGDQPSAVVVTTRSAAHRRGEKLPAVFQPKTH